jgi:hypothetical protein
MRDALLRPVMFSQVLGVSSLPVSNLLASSPLLAKLLLVSSLCTLISQPTSSHCVTSTYPSLYLATSFLSPTTPFSPFFSSMTLSSFTSHLSLASPSFTLFVASSYMTQPSPFPFSLPSPPCTSPCVTIPFSPP